MKQLLRMQPALLLLATLLFPTGTARAQEDSVEEKTLAISAAMRDGEYERASKLSKEVLKSEPDVKVKLFLADNLLRCGEASTALKLFDEYVKARPESEPYLWQRGIAQYFAGEFTRRVSSSLRFTERSIPTMSKMRRGISCAWPNTNRPKPRKSCSCPPPAIRGLP